MSSSGLGIAELVILLLICGVVLLAIGAAALATILIRGSRATPVPPAGPPAAGANSAPGPDSAAGSPRTCPGCGAFLLDDAKFCHRCGCPV